MTTPKNITSAITRINNARINKLFYLDLSGLFLSELPIDISDMIYLIEINLSYNSLTKLPDSISNLENLQILDISHNNLKEIEFEEGRYYCLKELNISHNLLNFLPESLDFLNSPEVIYNNNPFIDEADFDINYNNNFFKLKQYVDLVNESNAHRFYETKLIFVGRGEVGKTTLMKVLKNNKLDVVLGSEKVTHGINIDFLEYDIFFEAGPPHYNSYKDIENVYLHNDYEQWLEWRDEDEDEDGDDYEKLTHISEILPSFDQEFEEHFKFSGDLRIFGDYLIEKTVKLNLWDFGGQEVYYSTHQFFLTKRSIYVFVWEPRKDNIEEEFDYWLNTINLLGPDSPTLVVMNKSDIRHKNIDKESYKNKFPNIKKFLEVSCYTKEGIEDLKVSIIDCIKNLPHIGNKIPESWIKIREKIQNLNTNYISFSQFINLCNNQSLMTLDNEINMFSEYLHDIGDIIHFKEDSILRNIVIINPQWATKAVYSLIDTIPIQKNNGTFELYELESYWDLNTYPIEKHIELLQLMEKFQICFKLIGAKNTYIIPELLQTEVPNQTVIDEIINNNPLRFQIEYSFMPSGLITRLICKVYNLIYQENFWKNGAVFIDDMSKALVRENRVKKQIEIFIQGNEKQNILSIIRNELKKIHSELNMIENQTFKERIPCVCNICRNSNNPNFFEYYILKDFISRGQDSIQCYNSANFVNIHELVSGYTSTKPNEKIISHILKAVSHLQGQNKIIINTEDARNQFISGRLSSACIIAKDQARWGTSEKGKSQGELDIKIEDNEGTILSIFEGINLSFINKKALTNHLNKIIDKYDPNGLFEKFLVIYFDGNNFIYFSSKYLSFIREYSYKTFFFETIIDESEIILKHTEIKVLRSIYTRSSKKVVLYHILVNLTE